MSEDQTTERKKMKCELKNNRGILWKNKFKRSERTPDYGGALFANGKPMAISLWVKQNCISIALSEDVSRFDLTLLDDGHDRGQAEPTTLDPTPVSDSQVHGSTSGHREKDDLPF